MSKVNPLIPYFKGNDDQASVSFNRGNVRVHVSEDGVEVMGNPIAARLRELLPEYDPETSALDYLRAQNWGALYVQIRNELKRR